MLFCIKFNLFRKVFICFSDLFIINGKKYEKVEVCVMVESVFVIIWKGDNVFNVSYNLDKDVFSEY